MKNRFLEKLSSIYRDKNNRKKINRIFFSMAAIVVFITSYVLILPAITVEKNKALENNIPINKDEIVIPKTIPKRKVAEIKSDTEIMGENIGEKEEVEENSRIEESSKNNIEKENKKENNKANPKKENRQEEQTIGKEELENTNKSNNNKENIIGEDKNTTINEDKKKLEKEEINNPVRREIEFVSKDRNLKVVARLENSNLPEDALVKIRPIRENGNQKANKILNYSGFRSIGSKEITDIIAEDIANKKSPLEKKLKENKELTDHIQLEELKNLDYKTKQIEEKIEGKIEEILFYDISFFTPEGDYIPVDDKARVSLNISEENLNKSEDEEITVVHFGKDEMTLLDAKIELGQDNKVEEITFNTEGFSVFAVIKHSTWTEVTIPTGIYTIITNVGGNYKFLKNTSQSLGKMDSDNLKWTDINSSSGIDGHLLYFKDGVNTDNYKKFLISKKNGNKYEVYDIETGKYLTCNQDGLTLKAQPFKMKFYENSKYPGELRISASGEKYGISYDTYTSTYQVQDKYQDENNNIAYHKLVKSDKLYKILSEGEVKSKITNLSVNQSVKMIIVSAIGETDNRRSLMSTHVESQYGNTAHLDSTSLLEEEGKLRSIIDKDRDYKYREADLWKITKIDRSGTFTIQDKNNKYLTLNYFNIGVEDMVGSNSELKIHQREGNIYRIRSGVLKNLNHWAGGTTWGVGDNTFHQDTRIYFAEPIEEKEISVIGKEKLAHIPDGDYIIGNSPNIHGDFVNPADPNHEDFANRQELNSLQENLSKGDGWLHYNEKAANDNTEHHTIEKKGAEALDEWKFIQTEKPGHYYIKNKSGSYLSLYQGLAIENTPKEVSIYKNEEKLDQVLITQGNYRLRFDGTWKVVANSEPLTNADYHYIGKKITKYLNFKLTNPDGTIIDTNGVSTNPDEKNKWDNNVRLMEKIKVDNLQESLKSNIPKGYFEESEIATIYEDQHQGQANPYTNLYRITQSKDNLPANVKEEDVKEGHYKEYALIGWEYEYNGKKYLIDKDAKFIIEKDENGVEKSEIEIEGSKVTVDGVVQTAKLSIPFENENPLKTKWREVSEPIYFYFNYGKGIMDIERGISVKDALERENQFSTTPVIAKGRLFFGQDKKKPIEVDKDGLSVITADHKINGKFKSKVSLEFPDSLNGKLEDKQYNQIVMNKIVKVPPQNQNQPSVELEGKDLITAGLLKKQSIDWARESNTIVAILKKSITGGPDVDFEPDKININTDNYKVDYLWIDRKNNGTYLQGIVYADTAEVIVEKEFKNLSKDEVKNIGKVHTTSYGTNEKFHVNMMVDKNRATGGERQYDDILYSLSFDGENIDASPYPNIGELPVSYNNIKRVARKIEFGEKNTIVKWRVHAFDKERYLLHEKGVNFNDNKILYSRIEEYEKGSDRPIEIKRTLESSEHELLANVKSHVLRTGVYDYVRFNNLYTNGGVVLLTNYDKDTLQAIKGNEFILYKKNAGIEEEVYRDFTKENGNITFRDLEEGDYVLKENLPADSIYKVKNNIEFTIEKITGDKDYYKIRDSVNQPKDLVIIPSAVVEGKVTTNYIDVYNEAQNDTLTIEKDFKDTLHSEYEEILKNFKVIVKGSKYGVDYKKELGFNNADSSTYTQKVYWKLNKLEAEDGSKILVSELGEISIQEENYEHPKYPVVKRKAFFNDIQKDLAEYPYKISMETGEDAKNFFKLENTYTDTFEVVMQVHGRDREYNNYMPVESMEFEIYGAADEATTATTPTDFGVLGKYYRLDKPSKEGGVPQRAFITSDKGQTRILNLVYLKDTKYLIKQSKNPESGLDAEGMKTIYYPIEEPFELNLENVDGKLIPVAKNNTSVKGKMESEYQGGMLIIKLDLDRTNYRLPETGGIGTNIVKKVAMVIIFAAVTSLIYRKKYNKAKGEN